MKIDQLLRLLVIAIVLMIAFSLLGFVLKFGTVLLKVGVKVLIFLLIIAVVLRFIEVLRNKR